MFGNFRSSLRKKNAPLFDNLMGSRRVLDALAHGCMKPIPVAEITIKMKNVVRVTVSFQRKSTRPT